MGRVFGRVAAATVIAVALSLAGASAASAVPRGAVGGVQNPATSGGLTLHVLASDPDGVGLLRASARIDGFEMTSTDFAEGACRVPEVACPATVTLNVGLLGISDGLHRLDVSIMDELGAEQVIRYTIEVDNTPPISTPTVTVNIGSGTLLPSPPPDDGDTRPDGKDSPRCVAPRLSMFLAQRPLRFRRGVPVLAAGKRYRYLGQLTCRINGRRRPAKRGTIVEVRGRVGRRTVRHRPLKVRKDRRLLLKVAYRKSRVLIFRVRGAGGRKVTVRIKIRVVKTKRGRR